MVDTNFDKVVMFPTGNGFWNATQNSALLIVDVVHPMLGLRNRINCSYDYYFKKSRYYTAYNDIQIAKIKREIPELGFVVLRDDEKAYVFALKEKVSTDQMSEWRKAEELKRQKINAYFAPVGGDAGLYVLIRAFGKELLGLLQETKPVLREMIGHELVRLVIDMHRHNDGLASNNMDDRAEARRKMFAIVGDTSLLVAIAHDNKMVDEKKSVRVGTLLHSMRRELEVLQNKDV